MGFSFKSIVHKASSVASSAASTVSSAASGATEAVSSAAETVEDAVSSAAHSVGSEATSAWDAASQEGKEVAHAIESAGLTIGPGFVEGAQAGAKLAEEGVKVAEKGLVASGDYVSEHACDIALGSALSGVFVALAADGEEEATMAALAAAAAAATVAKVEISAAADAIAAFVVTPIFLIPQVKTAVGADNKSKFEAILAFVIKKAVTENPELVIGTAGQVVAGLIIATVTSIVCEGTVPAGGPRLWEGVNRTSRPLMGFARARATPRTPFERATSRARRRVPFSSTAPDGLCPGRLNVYGV